MNGYKVVVTRVDIGSIRGVDGIYRNHIRLKGVISDKSGSASFDYSTDNVLFIKDIPSGWGDCSLLLTDLRRYLDNNKNRILKGRSINE